MQQRIIISSSLHSHSATCDNPADAMIHPTVFWENLFCTAPDIRIAFAIVPADRPLSESMQHINACLYCQHMYTVSPKKHPHCLFCDNVGKCEPILIIFFHPETICRRSWNKICHLVSNLLTN